MPCFLVVVISKFGSTAHKQLTKQQHYFIVVICIIVWRCVRIVQEREHELEIMLYEI